MSRAWGGQVGGAGKAVLPTSDFLQGALCASSVCKRACKPPSRRRRVHATLFYVGRGLLPAFAQPSTPTDQLCKLRRLHTGAFQQRALVGHLVKSEPIFRISSGKFCVLNIDARCIQKWLYHEQLSLSMLFGFHQSIKLFFNTFWGQ